MGHGSRRHIHRVHSTVRRVHILYENGRWYGALLAADLMYSFEIMMDGDDDENSMFKTMEHLVAQSRYAFSIRRTNLYLFWRNHE